MSLKSLTFCFCHTLILTRRCAYRCGYCDYSTTYSRPLPPRKAIKKSLRRAIDAGSSQFHITGGEGIDEDPETLSTVHYYGLKTYIEYLGLVFEMALSANGEAGVFPVPQLGALPQEHLQQIKRYIPCIKIMLESADSGLLYQASHEHAAAKAPEERLEAILQAGRAKIPTTTGILVGIGESPASRMLSLKVLAEAHKRYGHIQNIVISRFRPRPGTPMEDFKPGNPQETAQCVAAARRLFGAGFPISVPVLEDPDMLRLAIQAGANDFGDVELTGDAARDQDCLQRLSLAQNMLSRYGVELRERLPVFPAYLNKDWVSDRMLEIAHSRHSLEASA